MSSRNVCEGWCGRDRFDLTGIAEFQPGGKCPLCEGTVPIPLPLTGSEQRELRPTYVPPPPAAVPKHLTRILKKQYKKSDFELRFIRFMKEQQAADFQADAESESESESESEPEPEPIPEEEDDHIESGNWQAPYCHVCGTQSPTPLCRKCDLLVKRTHRKLLL